MKNLFRMPIDDIEPVVLWEAFTEWTNRIKKSNLPLEVMQSQVARIFNRYVCGIKAYLSTRPNGGYHLFITAEGIPRHIPNVKLLAEHEPSISDWSVEYFHKANPHIEEVSVVGHTAHRSKVVYEYAKVHGRIGLRLYIEDYNDDDVWMSMAYMRLVDRTLGELEVYERVLFIELFPLADKDRHKYFPFETLYDTANRHHQEFNN